MSDSPRLLVVSPHPDDSILGAGGTMARFAANGGDVGVFTVAVHRPPLFSEATRSCQLAEMERAFALIGVRESRFLDLPALSVDRMPANELSDEIQRAVTQFRPNIVITPFPDRHPDHRAVFQSVVVATRAFSSGKRLTLVAACEILSSTDMIVPTIEPTFAPQWFVDISGFMRAKLEMMRACGSQLREPPHPRSLPALEALGRLRGAMAGLEFAEAFHVIRLVVPAEAVSAGFAARPAAVV
jgi:LmbE family N-acetylglucosaminyl deacetylase